MFYELFYFDILIFLNDYFIRIIIIRLNRVQQTIVYTPE